MKFSGVPYPITKDAKGYYRKQGGMNEVKSDLLILLLTNPGERVMLPNFGTDLRSLFFEPNDAIIAATARQLIINSIKLWEPRISVDQINVSTSVDKTVLNPMDNQSEIEHILYIQISFVDKEDISQVFDLELQVPLGGG